MRRSNHRCPFHCYCHDRDHDHDHHNSYDYNLRKKCLNDSGNSSSDRTDPSASSLDL